MNVLIYHNNERDFDGVWLNKLTSNLKLFDIKYNLIGKDDLTKKTSADAIFVLGGDGTVLYVNEFANLNNIPIIGINTGKLGFLSEFECDEIKDAIELFYSNKLKIDERAAMEINYKDKVYFALNDAFLQRIYTEETGCMVTDISVSVDGVNVSNIIGDGVIVSTPTGATAYSLSAGGSILEPGVNAFSVTPIAAHSFNQRPIVCSANSNYKIEVLGSASVGLFADGKYIGKLEKGDSFTLKKAKNPTVFLRKSDFNFFKRVHQKFNTDR